MENYRRNEESYKTNQHCVLLRDLIQPQKYPFLKNIHLLDIDVCSLLQIVQRCSYQG